MSGTSTIGNIRYVSKKMAACLQRGSRSHASSQFTVIAQILRPWWYPKSFQSTALFSRDNVIAACGLLT